MYWYNSQLFHIKLRKREALEDGTHFNRSNNSAWRVVWVLHWENETNRSHFTEYSCVGRKGHSPGPNSVTVLKLMLVFSIYFMVLKWAQTYRCNNYCKWQKIFFVWIMCYKCISQCESAAFPCPQLRQFAPGKDPAHNFFPAGDYFVLMGY